MTVVAVSGHMIDQPGRPSPRFPASSIGRVTAEMRRQLIDRWHDADPSTTNVFAQANRDNDRDGRHRAGSHF